MRNLLFTIVSLTIMFSIEKTLAQNQISVTEKKYICDSSGKFQSATLILEKDGTYLNYGLCIDKVNDDFYIWYSKGTYAIEGNYILCTFNEQKTNDPKLIQKIKDSFLLRTDHTLIANYFELVKNEYSSYKFIVSDNCVQDEMRGISYKKK